MGVSLRTSLKVGDLTSKFKLLVLNHVLNLDIWKRRAQTLWKILANKCAHMAGGKLVLLLQHISRENIHVGILTNTNFNFNMILAPHHTTKQKNKSRSFPILIRWTGEVTALTEGSNPQLLCKSNFRECNETLLSCSATKDLLWAKRTLSSLYQQYQQMVLLQTWI